MRAPTAGVLVETVDDLYARRKALDVPGYYEGDEENPYNGLCRVIPRKARFYTLVQEWDTARLDQARKIIKGVAGRRKVREVVCAKDEINYTLFARPGRVIVLFA